MWIAIGHIFKVGTQLLHMFFFFYSSLVKIIPPDMFLCLSQP